MKINYYIKDGLFTQKRKFIDEMKSNNNFKSYYTGDCTKLNPTKRGPPVVPKFDKGCLTLSFFLGFTHWQNHL